MINFNPNNILRQTIDKETELYDEDNFDEIDEERREEFCYN